MSELSRSIPVDGLFNLRDTGGYRAGDRRTRWGRLLRSDGLHHLGDAGRAQLDALGLGLVLDLRDDAEREHAPSLVSPGTRIVANPIFQSATESLRAGITLEGLYRHLLDDHGANYAIGLDRIASADERPVLVHCTAGKDRTGTLVALALTAVGVDRDDVLHDYALTEQNLAGPWLDRHVDMLTQYGVEITPEIMRLLGGSPAEALDGALNHVISRHGSVRDYLRACGLDDAQLDRLGERLTEPEPVLAG